MSEFGGRTLILALGNSLCGDDGVGMAVVQALSRQTTLPPNVTLSPQGVNGLLHALLGHRYRRIIIVDSAYMGCNPGEWIRFTPDDASINSAHPGGGWHGVSLGEILALANTLKVTLPELVIYGVQPLAIPRHPGLSDMVQKAVPDICAAILTEVEEQSS